MVFYIYLYPGIVNQDKLYWQYAHSPIQHIICNRNVFTNFLPCSHAINPNNETCLVTCAVSLTCATWLTYVCTVFLRSTPQPGYKYICLVRSRLVLHSRTHDQLECTKVGVKLIPQHHLPVEVDKTYQTMCMVGNTIGTSARVGCNGRYLAIRRDYWVCTS